MVFMEIICSFRVILKQKSKKYKILCKTTYGEVFKPMVE